MKEWYRELLANRKAYTKASPEERSAMETRALVFAAGTIHVPWSVSYRHLVEGPEYAGMIPILPAAKTWLFSRWGAPPDAWLRKRHNEKARFARMLVGAWDNSDVTRDTLMERYFPGARVTSVGQWALWLHNAYGRRFKNRGPEANTRVQREHVEVLRWVRTGRREEGWK